jgi:dienelactone hydrolase
MDGAGPGSYAVGYRHIEIDRPDGPSFWAWVFYPAIAGERDAAFVRDDERFPVVSFGHGFLQTVQRYRYSLRDLASHGYIVIATSSHHGLAPDHAEYSGDLARCLAYVVTSSNDEQSWLFGRVDEHALALSGHSMGGGAAVAASRGLEVKALITLAGAPLRSKPESDDHRPEHELHIVGDADLIVPVGATKTMIDDSGVIVTIRGGSHCGFMDETVIGCDEGELDHDEQLRITRTLIRSFLDLHLKGRTELEKEFAVEHPLEAQGLVRFERPSTPLEDD